MSKPLFTYEAVGNALIVHLPQELDHHNCTILKNETDLLLSENYINRIVFDFTDTTFMDSSGIGTLLNRYKQMAGSGKTVTIYGVGAQVLRIMRMGGIMKLMKLYESREDAVKD